MMSLISKTRWSDGNYCKGLLFFFEDEFHDWAMAQMLAK